MNLKTNTANSKNFGGLRDVDSIKYIVVHYTANDGDTDENNGAYFHNNVTGTSAHYFVDDDSVTQVVPDNRIAYHCGAKKYRHAYCRNTNSIGVELCDDVKDGVIYPSKQTIANAIELVEYLMKKYNVPRVNVIRHYDVTGKACPAYWCGSAAKDALWKSEFWNKLSVLGGLVANNATTANKKKEADDMVYYKTINDVPAAYKAAVQKVINAGALKGTGAGVLNLSEDLCRTLTILDRLGVLK